jgi:hypothetical protein
MFSAFETFEDPGFPLGEQHHDFRTQKKCTVDSKLFVGFFSKLRSGSREKVCKNLLHQERIVVIRFPDAI